MRNGERLAAFEKLVLVETDECVIWPFSRISSGYGQISLPPADRWSVRKTVRTHVMACTRRHGQPPSPLHEVAHSCHVRACMNYRHLRWATHDENMADQLHQPATGDTNE